MTTASKLARRDEPQSLAQSVPEHLRQTGPSRGMEQMSQEDRALPRLTICQSMSPQRKRTDSAFIEGLQEGEWFATVTGKVYGETCLVVPLLFFKTRVRFVPRDEGGGILCRADDYRHGVGDPGGDCTQCKLARFENGQPPECTNFFNYASLVVRDGKTRPRLDDLVVVSFKSTALKAAKAWNTLMSFRGTDTFKGVYQFSTRAEKNSKGEFYVPVIANAGWISESVTQDFERAFESMAAMQRDAGIKFDVEDLAAEREPGAE